MRYTTLGRTGLEVSAIGLGGGGHSRLGLATGHSEDDAVRVVRRAVDLGINFIDTARVYGTEAAVGRAVAGLPRDRVVISSKAPINGDEPVTAVQSVVESLEKSLRELRTDYIDVYHLHGVVPIQYDQAREELVPALRRLRDQGKVRFLGVTERFNADPQHEMLRRAVPDGEFDVVMVGFNILNQSARDRVLAPAQAVGVGTLCMFAVRAAFSRPDRLRQIVAELIEQGRVDAALVHAADPLAWVARADGVADLTEAAYRFCRHEPGMDVVLTGTGRVEHLEQNVASMLRPPLPDDVRARLVETFAAVDHISGQ